MWFEGFSGVQWPPIFTLLSTPPQPSLLASVYKVISGWERLTGLCNDLAEFIHHCKSLRDNSGRDINASKLPLFKGKAPVLSMSSDLKGKGPSFATGKVDMSNPRVDATSLTVGRGHCNRPWQVWMIFAIFSEVRWTVIVIESIIKVIWCCGKRDDFSGCTVNPWESNNLAVTLTFRSQSS